MDKKQPFFHQKHDFLAQKWLKLATIHIFIFIIYLKFGHFCEKSLCMYNYLIKYVIHMRKWLQLRALFVLFTSYPHLFTSYTAIVQKKIFLSL